MAGGGFGGMPGSGPSNAYQRSQTAPAQGNTQNSQGIAQAKPEDINKANKLKEAANGFFKQSKLAEASEKYYEAINTIRLNPDIKHSEEAKQIEIACRLNVALCKLTMKEYEIVIDQCERVLDQEPKNWKASFRMAQALYEQTKGESNIRSIHNYAKKALEGNPTDQKVK